MWGAPGQEVQGWVLVGVEAQQAWVARAVSHKPAVPGSLLWCRGQEPGWLMRRVRGLSLPISLFLTDPLGTRLL